VAALPEDDPYVDEEAAAKLAEAHDGSAGALHSVRSCMRPLAVVCPRPRPCVSVPCLCSALCVCVCVSVPCLCSALRYVHRWLLSHNGFLRARVCVCVIVTVILNDETRTYRAGALVRYKNAPAIFVMPFSQHLQQMVARLPSVANEYGSFTQI
jgi:hypothetical protein